MSPEDAAKIVVRHLRERVTINGGLPRGETPGGTPDQPAGEDARASRGGLPHDVPEIWLRQLTDEAGFEIIYVATLRSVGVPSRLDANRHAEFHDGNKWQVAPPPAVVSWKAVLNPNSEVWEPAPGVVGAPALLRLACRAAFVAPLTGEMPVPLGTKVVDG